MAAFESDFDAEKVDPKVSLEPIPAGSYLAVITASEVKDNSKGTGTYHEFTLEVIDGDHKGRKLWSRLNLNNPSQEAVAIARAELSAICRAVGVMRPTDSTQLHNIPLTVKVGLEKRKDTGDLTNVVKGYSAQENKAATVKKPWAKK